MIAFFRTHYRSPQEACKCPRAYRNPFWSGRRDSANWQCCNHGTRSSCTFYHRICLTSLNIVTAFFTFQSRAARGRIATCPKSMVRLSLVFTTPIGHLSITYELLQHFQLHSLTRSYRRTVQTHQSPPASHRTRKSLYGINTLYQKACYKNVIL